MPSAEPDQMSLAQLKESILKHGGTIMPRCSRGALVLQLKGLLAGPQTKPAARREVCPGPPALRSRPPQLKTPSRSYSVVSDPAPRSRPQKAIAKKPGKATPTSKSSEFSVLYGSASAEAPSKDRSLVVTAASKGLLRELIQYVELVMHTPVINVVYRAKASRYTGVLSLAKSAAGTRQDVVSCFSAMPLSGVTLKEPGHA